MVIICHRVNTIEKLRTIPERYGVEIDVRHDNRTGSLYLNHDTGEGDDLDAYLAHYHHAFIIFNIKEAGTEKRCIELAARHGIPKENYFLLDVEFPYIYYATRRGVREIAMRYSEDEPIEAVLNYKGQVGADGHGVDWVWIDTNTRLPLDESIIEKLSGLKTCLVCPERWGRPQDIPAYVEQMRELGFKLDAVMTALAHAEEWEKSGVVRL